MSKPLNKRAASTAFAQGLNPRTGCALTFRGDIAYSYAEPIAVRVGGTLHITTAKFSMTTSHHRGAVAGCFAIENGAENVIDTDHGVIREMARSRGEGVGSRGACYDVPKRQPRMIPDGHGFFMDNPRFTGAA